MACPTCGGTERRPIAPGFWECASLIYQQIPTGAHPSGQFGPAFATVATTCGRRYHEGGGGSSTSLCQTCTVFAIGVCADCRIPQCGNCGLHFRGTFLCKSCLTARRAAERAAEKEAAEAAAAAAARAKADGEATVRRNNETMETWLVATARALDGQVRRNHREGWKVSDLRIEKVTSSSGAYQQYSHTSKVRRLLVLTRSGELKLFRRNAQLGGRKWNHQVPLNHAVLRDVAQFIGSRYGVHVDDVPSPE